MNDVLSKRDCKLCKGTGKEFDLRAINQHIKKLDMKLQDIATALEISPPYLSLLMKGDRHWSPELVGRLMNLKDRNK